MDFWEFIQGLFSLGFVTTCIVVIMLIKRGMKPIAILLLIVTVGIALIAMYRKRKAASKATSAARHAASAPVYKITNL